MPQTVLHLLPMVLPLPLTLSLALLLLLLLLFLLFPLLLLPLSLSHALLIRFAAIVVDLMLFAAVAAGLQHK